MSRLTVFWLAVLAAVLGLALPVTAQPQQPTAVPPPVGVTAMNLCPGQTAPGQACLVEAAVSATLARLQTSGHRLAPSGTAGSSGPSPDAVRRAQERQNREREQAACIARCNSDQRCICTSCRHMVWSGDRCESVAASVARRLASEERRNEDQDENLADIRRRLNLPAWTRHATDAAPAVMGVPPPAPSPATGGILAPPPPAPPSAEPPADTRRSRRRERRR